MDSLGSGTVRLVSVNQNEIRFVGRVAVSESLAAEQSLRLLTADHSSLGDALAAVGASGDSASTPLSQGDTLTVSFEAPPVPDGKVRVWFLVTTGSYSASPASKGGPQLAARQVGSDDIPRVFALFPNRPNPFSRITQIRFDLPHAAPVMLEVFDARGRLVGRFVDKLYKAGRWSVEWDRRDRHGRRVVAGVYIYRLRAGEFRAQRRMVVF